MKFLDWKPIKWFIGLPMKTRIISAVVAGTVVVGSGVGVGVGVALNNDNNSSSNSSTSIEESIDSSIEDSSILDSSIDSSVEDSSSDNSSSADSSVDSSGDSSSDSSMDSSDDSSSDSTEPAPHEHDFTLEVIENAYLKAEATCTSKAVYYYACACGEQGEMTFEYGAILGHDLVLHGPQSATCTEKGWNAYETCSRCNYTTYVEIPALNHDRVQHDAQAVTCTEKGWDAYETCSRCDYTTYVEIPALDHDKVQHDAQSATCTAIGWDAYEMCSRCDYTTYVEIPALDHDRVQHDAQAVTCTEKGWDAYETCSRCDYTTYVEIPALNHDKVQHDAQAVTCTAIGWNAYETCNRCDYTTYAEISVLGHDKEQHSKQDPTCTKKGWAAYETCKRNGCTYTTYIEIPATGVHTWNNGEETTAATCTQEGVTTYTCTVCETATKTEAIAKLPHTHSQEWHYDSTYHYHECSCGNKKDQAAHTPSAPATATTSQTCTVCGYVIQAETGILFNTLSVNGTTVYGKVSNDTTMFSFIREVTVKGNAKYVVSFDVGGNDTINSKTIPLDIGDNTVYITESVNGEPVNFYIVTIRRRPMYTLTFDSNGGSAVETQTVEEDTIISTPITTRAGYTFVSWGYNFSAPITANGDMTAEWSANDDTKYTVNYYLQNLNDDDYTLQETDELEGTTDTTATAEIKEYTHFTYNESASTVSGNVDGDGSCVLSVYYTRDSYDIIAERNNTKAGTVTGSGTYRFDKQITLTATTNAGYTWLGWYDDDTLACETEEFTFNVEKNVTYTATWSANTDTKYTVNYYLQNLDNDNYTLQETDELEGTTDTTATAIIKEYTHFTYNASKSVINGNIDGDDSCVLSVYYTRDSYDIIAERNDTKAGTVTGSGTYRFDKQITLIATTNAGYTWLGWYDGETLVCATEEFTSNVDKNVTYTATWSANTDTKYTVKYYLQNLDNNEYTLQEMDVLEGTTDTTATAIIKEYTHFTYNESASTISGNINGNGSRVLSVYYTRNEYMLSINNTSAGTITNAGSHKYGASVNSTVTPYLGYNFLGWYHDDALLSIDTSYNFTVDRNIVAKFIAKDEMSNFNFTSTITSCSIEGIKDKTITEIIVPDYVTSISNGAFEGCSKLESITIPFVGAGKSASSGYNQVFGYIFGYTTSSSSSSISGATNQYYVTWTSSSYVYYKYYHYYIPTSLKKVTVTGGSIGPFAFYNCSSLTSITILDNVTSIGEYAFYDCDSLTSVVIPDSITTIGESAFRACALTEITLPFVGASKKASNGYDQVFGYIFGYTTSSNYYANFGTRQYATYSSEGDTYYYYYIPISLKKVTITGGSIGYCAFYSCDSLTSVDIGDSVTSIGPSAFQYCSNLTSVVIPDSVTSIGGSAFAYCRSLTSIVIPEGVTSIGDWAFNACYKLVEVVNKSPFITVTKGSTDNGDVGYYALAVYNSDSGVTESQLLNDNGYIICADGAAKILVGYSGSETDLVLPDYITKIYQYAFRNCISLTSVVIGDSVTSIGDYAFSNCNGLTSVVIGAKVISIGEYAFYNCDSLTSVVIPDSVISIGCSAFYNCDRLTKVIIGDSVEAIGAQAFFECRSLANVTFEDTSTWYRTTSSSDWQNKRGGTMTDVTSRFYIAEFFYDYYNYYWYKK